MISYQRAPTFTSGSNYITALDHYSMSLAMNDRLNRGAGDPCYRIHQYMLSMTRQVRNPADSVAPVFPAEAEWSETWAHVPPEAGSWPTVPPGEFEGSNLASPINQFVFGLFETPGDGGRFQASMSYVIGPGTPEELWEAAKLQRGAIDLNTGAQNVPMFEAAQYHMKLVFPSWSPMHKSYGGVQPIPDAQGYCVNDTAGWYDQIIQFEAVNNNSTYVDITTGQVYGPYTSNQRAPAYTGTCGPNAYRNELNGTPGADTDVAFIYEAPFAYFVYLFNGAIHRYDRSDWLLLKEGGGMFARNDADSIQRLGINAYLKEFRGTELQRGVTCYDLMSTAFDFQSFYEGQYYLAPAYGVDDGNGNVVADYPDHTFTGVVSNSQTPLWTMHDGYRYAGCRVKQNGAPQAFTVVLYEGGEESQRYTIGPDTSSICFMHPTGSTANVQFRIPETFTLGAGASINIEIAELQNYKPEIWDAYAVCRLGSTDGGEDEPHDVFAHEFDEAAVISDYYKSTGACVNVYGGFGPGQQQLYTNANPVHEAMRRQIQEWTRVLNRKQVVGYEVINDGGTLKSVLYFKRYITIPVDMSTGQGGNILVDAFPGIINTSSPSTNGIVTTAPAAGWTNEWNMFMNLTLYGGDMHDELDSSEYKINVYADHYPMIQRCHILNFNINGKNNVDIFRHMMPVRGGDYMISELYRERLFSPEAASAYNFIRNTNSDIFRIHTEDGKIGFYKSCRIYPDPLVIEEANVDSTVSAEFGEDIVRIQFTSRFDCDASMAASTVSRDMSTWNFDSIRDDQIYRTDENGIMQYLMVYFGYGNGNSLNPKIGDHSITAQGIIDDSGNPRGSIVPRFFFTKLIPIPYLKDYGLGPGIIPPATLASPTLMAAEAVDTDKTIITCDRFIQYETYLRAICEGFIDDTQNLNCSNPLLGDEVNNAWDYNYETLMDDANGDKWYTAMPVNVRSDVPIQYGPLPTLKIYAESVNRLCRAVNKLTKVRIALPFKLWTKTYTYQDSAFLTATDGNQPLCLENGTVKAAIYQTTGPSATTLVSETDWEDQGGGTGVGAVSSVGVAWAGDCGSNGEFFVTTTRTKTAYRLDVTDPLALNALHPDLQDLFQNGEFNGFFATRYHSKSSICHGKNYTQSESQCACFNNQNDCAELPNGTNYFWWNFNGLGYEPTFDYCPDDYDEQWCAVMSDGVIDAGATPPTSDFFFGQDNKIPPTICGTMGGGVLTTGVNIKGTEDAYITIPLR